MNPMEAFLKKGSFREVRITDHTHGNRVTLLENFREISFWVSDNIPMAFDEAFKNFEHNLKRHKEEELENLEKEKQQMETDLGTLERKIETAKNELKPTTKKIRTF
jgi:peptidoglycan hydrolase CwlO-like protein